MFHIFLLYQCLSLDMVDSSTVLFLILCSFCVLHFAVEWRVCRRSWSPCDCSAPVFTEKATSCQEGWWESRLRGCPPGAWPHLEPRHCWGQQASWRTCSDVPCLGLNWWPCPHRRTKGACASFTSFWDGWRQHRFDCILYSLDKKKGLFSCCTFMKKRFTFCALDVTCWFFFTSFPIWGNNSISMYLKSMKGNVNVSPEPLHLRWWMCVFVL